MLVSRFVLLGMALFLLVQCQTNPLSPRKVLFENDLVLIERAKNSYKRNAQKACILGRMSSCRFVESWDYVPNYNRIIAEATQGCAMEDGKQCFRLSLLQRRHVVAPTGVEEAVKTLNKSCRLQYEEACLQIASGKLSGSYGFQHDLNEGVEIMIPLCEKDNPKACYYLGRVMYEVYDSIQNGENPFEFSVDLGPKDADLRAIHLFRKSDTQLSNFALESIYKTGTINVTPDAEKAQYYQERANSKVDKDCAKITQAADRDFCYFSSGYFTKYVFTKK